MAQTKNKDFDELTYFEVRLIKALVALDSQTILPKQRYRKVSQVLQLVFHAGLRRVAYSETGKRNIAQLFKTTFVWIGLHITAECEAFRCRLESKILRLRSCLQFLIDDYGDFCTNSGESLRELLSERKIDYCINSLDRIIENWCDVFDLEDEYSDIESTGGLSAPATHAWWLRFNENIYAGTLVDVFFK